MIATPLQPLDPEAFDQRKAKHLLQRVGFGGTPKQSQALADLGLEKAVDYIINYQDLPDPNPTSLDDYDKDIIRPATQSERAAIRVARQNGNEDMVEMFRNERQRRQRADRKQVSEMELWYLLDSIASVGYFF